MSVLPKSVDNVIKEFSKLPGVGPKTAARMTYHYLRTPNKEASALANSLLDMDANTTICSKCFNVSDYDICDICSNEKRDISKLCIVEEPLDVVAFENAGVFDGIYFVLGGAISPAEGVGAEELRFKELSKRIEDLLKERENIELIVATNPSLEGEATASYIEDLFRKKSQEGKITITRLAMGLPTGADLEYADRLTLKRALDGRK